jgi:hypothetical protein
MSRSYLLAVPRPDEVAAGGEPSERPPRRGVTVNPYAYPPVTVPAKAPAFGLEVDAGGYRLRFAPDSEPR